MFAIVIHLAVARNRTVCSCTVSSCLHYFLALLPPPAVAEAGRGLWGFFGCCFFPPPKRLVTHSSILGMDPPWNWFNTFIDSCTSCDDKQIDGQTDITYMKVAAEPHYGTVVSKYYVARHLTPCLCIPQMNRWKRWPVDCVRLPGCACSGYVRIPPMLAQEQTFKVCLTHRVLRGLQ